MKTCHFCGNRNFKKATVQYTYKLDGKYLMIDDVPCEQCEFCGEQYFAVKTLKLIENEFDAIYSHKKKASGELTMPLESYTEIASV